MRAKDVSKWHKKALKKALLYFSHVDEIDVRQIQWSSLTYHKHQATYKMLMNLCYLVIEGLLLTEKAGSYELAQFVDDQHMHRLYEKFVLAFYRKHYPEFRAAPTHISWDTDDEVIEFLPVMKTDITLTYQGKTLIIDTKYYNHTMQTHFQRKTFHSDNLYQIYTYVKNKDRAKTGLVRGVILYAKTSEAIVPNHAFTLSGNKIGVMTLDLNTDFQQIKQQLHHLVNTFLLA